MLKLPAHLVQRVCHIEYYQMVELQKIPKPLQAERRTLRSIAIFEALKGIVAIAASIGLLELLHRDIRHIALQLIGHLGMSPGARYPSILLHYADVLHDSDLQTFLLLTMCYASIRMVEAYGLWHEFEWAEWIGALSGAIYIPFEIHHIAHRPSVTGIVVFTINAFIVGFLAYQLWRRRALAI
ncbi:MAG: DUF2127 domain-containing protein [Burkholderiales bacterium]